jgi:hypothetical protein
MEVESHTIAYGDDTGGLTITKIDDTTNAEEYKFNRNMIRSMCTAPAPRHKTGVVNTTKQSTMGGGRNNVCSRNKVNQNLYVHSNTKLCTA